MYQVHILNLRHLAATINLIKNLSHQGRKVKEILCKIGTSVSTQREEGERDFCKISTCVRY